jgi:lipopolysaccharide export LptBFGC system permease protein LptF
MKTLDAYILREWFIWFLACLGFLLSVLCLFSIADDISNVFPAGFNSVAYDLLIWCWSFLPWLLPICALLSGLFLTGFLIKSGEWKAIQSLGFSTVWCFRSVLLLGLVLSYACWLISSTELTHESQSQQKKQSLRPLSMKIGTERMWYFSSFDESEMSGREVQLFQYNKSGGDVFRIRADKASWHPTHGWTFYDGQFLGFLSNNSFPIPNKNGSGLSWESLGGDGANLPLTGSKSPRINKTFNRLGGLSLADDPSPYLLLRVKPKKMSFQQLDRLVKKYPGTEKKILAPYYLQKAQLLWNGPACLIALLGGLLLGTSKFATSPGRIGGLSIAVALFFYVIRTLSDSLAETGIIEPNLGASLPYVIASLAILFLSQFRQ